MEAIAIAIDDYPPTKVAWTLCKLSMDGKAHIYPTDNNPNSPWIWRFEPAYASAITALLLRSEIEFVNV